MRIHDRIGALVLLGLVDGAWPAAGERLEIPGTRVTLEAPDGFELASRFPGLQNAELATSIMVSELPGPFAEVTAGFTEEGLLRGGMSLVSSEEVVLSERPGRLLSVTQTAQGAAFEKWMAAVGDAHSTVLIVATYPVALSGRMRAPMREAVLSAVWNREAELDPFEGLSFRIRETQRLKIQKRVPNTLLLTAPDAKAQREPADPYAVVGSSHSPLRIDDVEAFARQRITQTAEISGLRELKGRKLRVADRAAYELIGKARDEDSGEPLAIYQLVVVDGDAYYLVQGLVGEKAFAGYLPEFRALGESLEIP